MAGASDAPISIKVEGLAELRAALKKIQDPNLQSELQEEHKKVSFVVARATAPNVPVRTARLFKAIRAMPTKTTGGVGIARSVPYGGVIHFGWPKRNISPNRFFYRTIREKEHDIVTTYEQGVNRILKRAGLKVGS